MTPLARQIADDLTLPVSRRLVFGDGIENLFEAMYGVHCFEVTEVVELVEHYLANSKDFRGWVSDHLDTLFLPAPKTWIEFQGRDGRAAALLEEAPGDKVAVSIANQRIVRWFGYVNLKTRQLEPTQEVMDECPTKYASMMLYPFGFLPLINTPKIIGRRQHMPNRKLEKRLTRALGAGKFPLKAWTEIKLSVSKPMEIDDELHEAHLTGQRALHFCRAHLRIRRGQLEYVSSHWRGDPAIGIKQSRYKIQR